MLLSSVFEGFERETLLRACLMHTNSSQTETKLEEVEVRRVVDFSPPKAYPDAIVELCAM